MRRYFDRRGSFKLCFEALESRHLLSGTQLPFDDSGLAPANLQAICALPNLPVFNVHNYGAVGNGVADDTVAIRAALSAAEANGGGIIYLPSGTYDVDPQATDPVAWGAIFTITSSNIVFIGDHDPLTGATETHLKGYVEGLKDPATNWIVTGEDYGKIGRFAMFQIGRAYASNISTIQFRSLDINGQAGFTGDADVGGTNIQFLFSTNTDSSPSAGQANFNNASPASATVLYLNQFDKDGTDQTTLLNTFAAGGKLSFWDANLDIVYTLQVSSGSLSGGVYTLNLSSVILTTGSGPLVASDNVYLMNGDGWDVSHKAILMDGNGSHQISGVLVFNCNIENWRGEEVYAGGDNVGTVAVINSWIHGTNSSAISCSAVVTVAYTTIGGSNASVDACANAGAENLILPGQNCTITNCTIENVGSGISMEGCDGTTSFTCSNTTFTNCVHGLLLQDALHNATISGCTFTNCGAAIIQSNLGLYPGITEGMFNIAISGCTFDSTNGIVWQSGDVYGMAISDCTVQAGNLLSGDWTYVTLSDGFTVTDCDLTGGAACSLNYQGKTALWSGTTWPLPSTPYIQYWSGTPFSDYSGATSGNMSMYSDHTYLLTNGAAGQFMLTLDPATLSNYQVGFQTTIYPINDNNWVLKADPTWNTFSSDLPIGPNGLTIRVNAQGLFELVDPTARTATTTSVTSSLSSSTFDQAITLTAIVTASTPGANVPTASVTFYDGSAVLGTGTLDSTGTATWTTSVLAVGSHTITALYSGDENSATSSGQVAQTVSQLTTTSALTSSAISSVFGDLVTFTVNVTANATGSGIPTGTVTFRNGSTVLGVVALDTAGKATFSTSTLSVGSHTITTSYSGDIDSATSSDQLTQLVFGARTTTTAVSSASPSLLGQSVTITANVGDTCSLTPTGTVTFRDGSAILVTGGKLKLSATSGSSLVGSGVTVTTTSAGTLELAGSVSALGSGPNRVNITNLSSAAGGILVSGTHQLVGNIDGTGVTQVNAGSDLTADHIIQTALMIGGTAGSPAAVTIAASDASGAPLQVTSSADSGPDSLRQALLDAAGEPGLTHTIQFELPAGQQTISPASPLPTVNDRLTVSVDATQNVTIDCSSIAAWSSNHSLILTGAGRLNLRGGIEGTGSLSISAGSDFSASHIIQNVLVIGGAPGSPATVTIAASDASGNPLITPAETLASATSASAVSVTGSGIAGASETLAKRLAAIRSRRLEQQPTTNLASTAANEASLGINTPAVIGAATASTSAAVSSGISSAVRTSPMNSVLETAPLEASAKSAAITTPVSFNPASPSGQNYYSVFDFDMNVATSFVVSQTSSGAVHDATAARKKLDTYGVAAVFGADQWEWCGSDLVSGSSRSSMDDVGGLVLTDDALEVIGTEWGNCEQNRESPRTGSPLSFASSSLA